MDKIQILAVVLFKRKEVRIIRIIESISKSVNSAKPSIVMASSNETSIADENETNLDMILSEISKLNSKAPKLLKQANDFSKSDEHSDKKPINQLNHFKTVVDLCKYFNYLFYIFQEETPICNLTILNPLHII